MKSHNKNLIRSVLFDVEAAVEADASIVADAIARIDHQLVFGKMLEKYDDINRVIRFDKIELDLGRIDLSDLIKLEEELIRLFDETITDKLQKSSYKSIISTQASTNGNKKDEDIESAEESFYSVEDKIELLLCYFRTGALPWNVSSTPQLQKLLLEVLETSPKQLRQQLSPILRRPDVVKRLVFSLPSEASMQLLQLYITPENWVVIEKVFSALSKNMPAQYQAEFKQEQFFISFRMIDKDHFAHESFLDSFLVELKRSLQKSKAFITDAVQDDVAELVLKGNASDERVFKKVLLLIEEVLEVNNNSEKEIEVANLQTSLEKRIAEEKGEENADYAEAIDQEAVFIDNSGLVLLASFLPTAFKKLNWVENGVIVGVKSKYKMLLWMDYLIWGERKSYEYNLSFNKILAGMSLHEVANVSLKLTDEEKTTADDLLKAVIQHWSILKNTSVEGLRLSFLQRNGKMNNEDGGWQLHVASRTYDILIDSLSWGFSIIKFPWMDKPLYTQWRAKI